MSSETSTDSIWKNDHLNRREDARLLIDFLSNYSNNKNPLKENNSYVLNLDARWGDGKTFFLKNFEQQLQHEGYIVAYVDAWRNDHTSQPLVTVLAAIQKALEPHYSDHGRKLWNKILSNAGKIFLAGATGLISQASKKILGDGYEDVKELIVGEGEVPDGENLLVDATVDSASTEIANVADSAVRESISLLNNRNYSIQSFGENLSTLLKDIKNKKKKKLPFFVLIDELDRCKPSFSVELLEHVKHIFNIPNVCFIIATDTDQLCSTINCIYGTNFDSRKYLQRFIDKTYKFQNPPLNKFVDNLIQHYGITEKQFYKLSNMTSSEYLTEYASIRNLSPREINRYIETISNICLIWQYEAPIFFPYLLELIALYEENYSDFCLLTEAPQEYYRKHSLQSVNIDFAFCDDFGRPQLPSTISANKIIQKFINASLDPDAMRRQLGDQDYLGHWIANFFFSKSYSKSQRELVAEYPDLVKGCSRLSQPT